MILVNAQKGASLQGDKVVRFAYLDESGTGSVKKEPYLVIAGVVINADSQWKRVEKYLSDMADDFALPAERDGFCFHATQLAGGDSAFNKKYDAPKRLHFLRALCAIPENFSFPLVMGRADRVAIAKEFPQMTLEQHTSVAIIQSANACAFQVEMLMRAHFPNEVALLVYEQSGKHSKYIRIVQNMFKEQRVKDWLLSNLPQRGDTGLTRIIDTAHFAGKEDTSILQIVDAASHVFARKLRAANTDSKCFESLLKQIPKIPKYWEAEAKALGLLPA